MPTDIELKAGLNMEIGSVPLSLSVEYKDVDGKSVYTFNGCVQDAVIPLKDFLRYVGQQFGVDVQLPPELNLEAKIAYLAGQVIYTKPATGTPTTELGTAGRFELTVNTSTYGLNFYADTVINGNTTGNAYVVGASVDVNLDFSKIPLVGNIPGFKDYSLTNIGFSYTNADNKDVQFNIPQVSASANPLFTRNDPTAPNSKNYSITSDGNKQNLTLNKKGFSLTAALSKNGNSDNSFALPLNLPAAPTPPSEDAPPPNFDKSTTSPPSTSVHWLDINKKFGPVDLQRIGLNYSGGNATFGFSAGFALGPFSMGLQEMTITFPMPLPGIPAGNTVSFDLQGLTLSIKTSSLQIGGGFLKGKAPDGAAAYYGTVLVQVGSFSLKALGGYIPEHITNGQKIDASFFIYANVQVPLGGPPYLYLNGFAGGFGINNLLKLPTLQSLPGYILLPGPGSKAPAQGDSAEDTLKTVMPQMQEYFIPKPGEYWAAAGVSFSSFEMINAFAVLTVAFGVDFQIAVLGSCSMSFPKGAATPIAYVEIDLMASYSSATGLLAVEGILSPASYIFGSYCQITGGFAFYVWIDPPVVPNGPRKGDFVVTLGGYHPAYVPPPYYPTVPRLGINFNLGSFHVTGGCYFALTPGMFMAGFSWNATFSLSFVKVWFRVGADFLIAWAPFHYEASAYVNLGCSVDLGLFTVNLSVGATLLLWGPPFGGQAEVDLDIVSFTISFGAKQQPAAPIGWQDFRSKFLPGDTGSQPQHIAMRAMQSRLANAPTQRTNIIKASASKDVLDTDVDGFNWILDPNKFNIGITSTIPINDPQWATGKDTFKQLSNDPKDYNIFPPPPDKEDWPYLVFTNKGAQMDDKHIWNPTVNIKPMKLNGVTSTLYVSVLKADNDGNYNSYVTSLTVRPDVLDSAGALWSENKGDKVKLDDAAFLKSSLTGLIFSPMPRIPNIVNGVKLILLLYQQGNDYYFNYQQAVVDKNYQVHSEEKTVDNVDTLTITVTGNHTASMDNKGYVLSSLTDTWVSSQRSAILADLNKQGFSTYTEVNLTTFAKETILTDWPEVMLLGDSLVA